jgi:hypothetical protein
MFHLGYDDAKANRHIFDDFFTPFWIILIW